MNVHNPFDFLQLQLPLPEASKGSCKLSQLMGIRRYL